MKRFILIVLILGTAFLSGCGGQGESSDGENTSETTEESVRVTTQYEL